MTSRLNRIFEYRIRRGYTQKQLAEMIDITGVSISRYERDDEYLGLPVLIKLAQALDVSVSDLVRTDDGEVERLTAEVGNAHRAIDDALVAHREIVERCFAERDEADRRAGAADRRLQRYKAKVRDQGAAIADIAPYLSASLDSLTCGPEYIAACEAIFKLDPTMKVTPDEPS